MWDCVLVAVLLGSAVKSAALRYYYVVCWHLAHRGQHWSPFQNVRTRIVFKWVAHTPGRRHVEARPRWPRARWWRADCFEWKTADIISDSDFFFPPVLCAICWKALERIWLMSERICFYLVYFLSASHRQYQINKCGAFCVKLRWMLAASNAQPLCRFSSFVKNNAFFFFFFCSSVCRSFPVWFPAPIGIFL